MGNPLNIVVVICHDLGQHVGCYDARGVSSEHIDAFAESGIRFERSFCTAPQCSPSRAALWTGRYPHANGVVGLTHAGFANDLHPKEKHLAQLLRAGGYETHLFGVQHEARNAERCGHEYRHGGGPCAAIAESFSDLLASRSAADRPLFAQVNFFEPHRPFPHENVESLSPDRVVVPAYLPDIPEARADLADYEASIASADMAFGRIVESVDSSAIADSTLIIFTADHGAPFPRAKMTLYDPGIEAALLVRMPGGPAGLVRREMISNVDVLPTLLDLAGLSCPENLHGRSFAGLISGGDYIPNDVVYAEKTYHTYYDPMRAIRTERWKLIANFECAPWQETSPDYLNNAKGYPEISKALHVSSANHYHPPFELYDLDNDPHEQHNLAEESDKKSVRDELIRSLRSWMEKTDDPLLDGPMAQGAYRHRMAEFKTSKTQ